MKIMSEIQQAVRLSESQNSVFVLVVAYYCSLAPMPVGRECALLFLDTQTVKPNESPTVTHFGVEQNF
jgi:hypothetical protein